MKTSTLPIDLSHLELFTDGDLKEEKLIVDAFLSGGSECCRAFQGHLDGQSNDDEWRKAAHKLKGSAAQIGAKTLAALCLEAEHNSKSGPEKKQVIYQNITLQFEAVRNFFEKRQEELRS